MSEVIPEEENDDIVPACGAAEQVIPVIDSTWNHRDIRRKGLSLPIIKRGHEKSSIHGHNR